MKRIRVGVIGLGGHLLDHLKPAKKLGFELVALFDTSEENALIAIGKLELDREQVKLYEDLEVFMQEAEVDVILIGSPDSFHATQLLVAIQGLVARGLRVPVMVEKPAAVTKDDLQKFREASELAMRHEIVITSCHIREFDPPYMWVGENLPHLIAEHGPLVHIKLDFKYPEPKPGEWKAIIRKLLADHGPHEVHIILRWLGINVPFKIVRRDDGPLGYRAEGWHGEEANRVTFEFCGSRKAKRSAEGRGAYPETIELFFADGYIVVVKTHPQAEAGPIDGAHEIILVKTDYDLRLLGVMGNIAAVLEGEPSYLDPELLSLIVESVVYLSIPEEGEYMYAP